MGDNRVVIKYPEILYRTAQVTAWDIEIGLLLGIYFISDRIP